jgi:hypothetical protein
MSFADHMLFICSLRSLPLERFRRLPTLPPPTNRIPELLPADWIHDPPLLAPRHDHAKLIPICRNIIIALIPQAYNHSPNQIAYPKRLGDDDLVFLGCPDVFAPDLPREGFAAHGVVDYEDLAGGEACAEAGDAGEDDTVD